MSGVATVEAASGAVLALLPACQSASPHGEGIDTGNG